MGNLSPDGSQKGVEALFDSLWPRVLSRGFTLVGWPMLLFVAYELWTTGSEMVQAQRELAFDVRSLTKDVNNHEERLDSLERRDRRYRPQTSQPDETP